MRIVELILGMVWLIIGVIALGIGAIAYNQYVIDSARIAGNFLLNTAANRAVISNYFEDSILGLIIGITFFVMGIVMVIIGFKEKKNEI